MLHRVNANILTDIAGFDFGCVINVRSFTRASGEHTNNSQGSDTLVDVNGPISGSQYDGPTQMQHFTRRGYLNIYSIIELVYKVLGLFTEQFFINSL